MITIKFLNNNGGGFGSRINIEEGTSLVEFINDYVATNEDLQNEDAEWIPSNWKIRVNRNIQVKGYILQDGDRVSITPVNVKGA